MDKDYLILLYLRVSNEDKDAREGKKDESNSIANQRDLLHDYLTGKPEFSGCKVMELCDDGYSGTNFDRPAVKQLLQKAKDRTVDCIIVKDFSRFGRDYLTVSDYVDQIFPFLGIRFISVNDGYDSAEYNGTTSGVDVAFRNIVYAYYSKDISEKVRSGKRIKAERGDYLSPFAPIGYRKDTKSKNHLLVDETSAEIVRHIFKLAGAGIPVVKIAKLLNVEKIPTPSNLKREQGLSHKWWDGVCEKPLWDISSITRILRDERYLGKNIYGRRYCPEIGNKKTRKNERDNWIIVPNCHEPIVTEEEFQSAQDMLKRHVEYNNRCVDKHIFSGKVRCGVCGYALIREGTKLPVYKCGTNRRAEGFNCMKEFITEKELIEVVWLAIQFYCAVLLENGEFHKGPAPYGDITYLKKQIAEYQSAFRSFDEQKAILYERMADGDFDRNQYVYKRDVISIQQDHLKSEIERLEKSILAATQQEGGDSPSIHHVIDYLRAGGLNRKMVEELVKCIYVYHDRSIRIDWLFDLRTDLATF